MTAPFWLPWRLLGWLRWRRRDRPTLHVRLGGSLPDVHSQRGLVGLLRPESGLTLLGLLDVLEEAIADPKLSTVLIQVDELHCGLGRAEEVRAALARVRDAGKRVIVHADELGLSGYWAALGASSVRLSPTGSLDVSGVAMEFTLLRGLLDRVGVQAQLLALGKYKSMREAFTESAMSSANREMLTSLVDDLGAQLVSQVASARGQSEESARQHLDHGPFRAAEARERGLIDTTQYWDELWDEVGGEASRVSGLTAYRKLTRRKHIGVHRPVQVGLLRINGNIRTGHDRQGASGPSATGSQSLRKALRHLTKSPRIRAILVRVDSPGGSALASDLMWRELTLASQKKPMFVSMVNVAASGGYYASGVKGVPVWASATTLTGSIGVVGGKFEVSGLLSRLGVGRETISSSAHANFNSISTPWNSSELAKLEGDLAALYRDFVEKMAEARGLSYEALHAVAQGRVWTGQQAREVALVDHLGGFHDVERALRQKLGLAANVALRWITPSSGRGLMGRRREAEAVASIAQVFRGALPDVAEALELALDLGGERLLALSPVRLRDGRG